MAAPPINIARLSELSKILKSMGEQRKNVKSQYDDIQTQATNALMSMGKRYIDESGTGAGPFWTLCKDKKEGNWRAERYMEFFTIILTQMNSGTKFTPNQLAELAVQYLKQFEKRGLKVEPHTQIRGKGVEDLRAWLDGKAE